MMKMRKNFFAINLLCGMAAALIFAALLTGCIPFEGTIEEVRQKAESGNGGTVPAALKIYTVTFDINGAEGDIPEAQTVTEGSTVTLPNRDGFNMSKFSFGGWNTEADGTGTNHKAGSFYLPGASVILYAEWNTAYTVMFDINGGEGDTPPEQTVVVDAEMTLPDGAGLSKANHTFEGWNRNALGTGTNYAADSSHVFNADLTLYANWKGIPYTVSFITTGPGTPPSHGPVTVVYDNTVPKPPVLSNPGYGIEGWYTEGSFTTKWNFETDTVKGDMTLYAKWLTNYTVSFVSNGGSAVSPITVMSGFAATRPTNPTRTNHVFDNWYTTASLTTEYDFSTPVTGSITLHAKWKITHIVRFNANGGVGGTVDTTHTYNDFKSLRANTFTYSGRVFAGWSTTPGGVAKYWDRQAIGHLQDITAGSIVNLYAVWNTPVTVTGSGLSAKLQWLKTNAQSNTTYTVETSDEMIIADNDYLDITYFIGTKRTNVVVILRGQAQMRNLTLYSLRPGYMFYVGSDTTLVLDGNITLTGFSNNTDPLVYVNMGRLVINDGSIIRNNNRVLTSSGMAGGGGVYVGMGHAIMNGGEVSGNTIRSSDPGASLCGGGIGLLMGSFTMNGGVISGNTLTKTSDNPTNYNVGGGVGGYMSDYVAINGGTISGNTFSAGGDFSGGGGVGMFVSYFAMNGGTISGNTAAVGSNGQGGGGVFLFGLEMNKTGGIIYGSTAGSNRNVVVTAISGGFNVSNKGHAVLAHNVKDAPSTIIKRKETDAGEGVNLYFSTPLLAGDTSWSGGWDN